MGKQIKEIRNSYNLSQNRFGKRLGLSGKTISAYENNKITPPLKTLKKISKEYKVALYDLPKQHQSEIEEKITEAQDVITELKSIIYKGLTF